MKRRWILWAVLAALLLAGALAWQSTKAPSVAAVRVETAPLVRTLQVSGRVATVSRVDVGSTVTGRVSSVAVLEGQPVQRGDVLVRLEDIELQAALAQARAQRDQAAAALVGLRSTGRRGAEAGVAQASAVLRAAQTELQRTRDLVARGFLGQARLDESERALAVARAQLDGAQAQRAATAEQGSDVAQALAQKGLAEAAVALAEARLAQSVLRAPTDARVLARKVEPGQIVQAGRALLTLALAGQLELVAPVDERFLGQLQVGQGTSVLADAYPGRRFMARVLRIAPLVDAQRGSVEVTFALLPPVPDVLREDMTLSLEIETGRRERTRVLPLAALRGAVAGDRAVAWIAVDGRVAARPLRLGLRTLDQVEVLEGLTDGDLVLLGDAPVPGSRVKADTSLPAPRASARNPNDSGAALTNAMGR